MKINQVKAGAILSYVIIVVNNIVGLVYTPFMLRMLGQNEYGLFSLVSSVVTYLTVLDLGFNNAVIRYTSKYRAEGKKEEQYKLFGMFLILYLIIGVIVLIIGGILFVNVENLFHRTMTPEDLDKIRIMMALLVANIAFTFPMSIWGGIITAYENFVFQKLVNLLRVILNPIVMVILLLHGYKAIGMVVVTTIFNVLTLLINAYYCFRKLHIKIVFDTIRIPFLKEIAFYSFWIFLCAVVDRLYWGSGQFVLGLFRSPSEIAIFAVAIQIQSLYTGFSYAISNVLLPRIVKLVSDGNPRNVISDYFLKISRIQFYPISLILFGFILFGRQFIILWAGKDYEPAYYMAICFMAPQLFTTMQQTAYSVLQAMNKVKFRSLAIFFSSVVAVTIAIPLAKLFGGIGVALCIAFGLILGNLLILDVYYHRIIGLNMKSFWSDAVKLCIWPTILTLVFFLIKKIAPHENLLIYLFSILIYSVLYIIGCYFISFNRDEKKMVLTPLERLLRR